MYLPQKTSKSEYAELSIELNAKHITAGGVLKGQVIVLTKKNISSCNLRVEFTGREYCKIAKVNPSDKDAEEILDLIPPDNKLVMEKQPCTENIIYKHEFRFIIPKTSPATFEATYDNVEGYIRYLIMATFSAEGYPDMITWSKIKINEEFPMEQGVYLRSEAAITGYCSSGQGKLNAACMVKSPASKENINNHIEGIIVIDNRECDYEITLIDIKRVQRINMHAKHRNCIKEDIVTTWAYPEIKSSEEKQIPFKIEIPCENKYKSMCTSSKGCLLRREYMMTLLPTYDSLTCFNTHLIIKFAIENLKIYSGKGKKENNAIGII